MASEETVGDLAAQHQAAPNIVPAGVPISAAIEALLGRPKGRSVYVVDGEGKLLGVVSFRDVLRVTNARFGAGGSGWFGNLRQLMREHVEDIMRKATPVHAKMPLRDALQILEATKQNDLPIVDDDGRLVGELNALQVLELGLRVFRETEGDLAVSRERAPE